LPTATWAAKSAATRDCPRPPFLQCAQLAVGSRRIDTTVVERWRQLPDGQIEFTTRCRTTNLLRETFTLPLHAARLKARQILNDYPQNGRSRSSSNRSARSRGRSVQVPQVRQILARHISCARTVALKSRQTGHERYSLSVPYQQWCLLSSWRAGCGHIPAGLACNAHL
jgi:hypothetical protein